MSVKRIAITGPESTGKSVLARQLAEYFHTSWVEEYAREYLDLLGRPYEENDILSIAKGQMDHENEQLQKADKIFFADTELIVTKIWSDVKYGRCDKWILENITLHPYDMYLLCYIDLPWIDDPQREHPHMRNELFLLYKNELEKRNLPFGIVTGTGTDRLLNAVDLLKKRGLVP